jgi:ubiquinone/menaquinone biosynthesis C-methylase UbiE
MSTESLPSAAAARSFGRAIYTVSQAARVSWFVAQSRIAAQLSRRLSPPRPKAPASGRTTPGFGEILADLRGLLARDLRNVERGYYRMPEPLSLSPKKAIADTVRFFRDVPEVTRRRVGRVNTEVFEANRADLRLPRYYVQNFHYQTDGYLSDHSARLYDHQVEVLFAGGADTMRRQALVPIWDYLKDRRIGDCRLLDVGAGTGRFLAMVKQNYPRLPVVALDLSPNYLAEARRHLAPWSRASLVQGGAEQIPAADGSFDLVTCLFLFHELPRKIRAQSAGEFARVLKAGGRLVFLESLQTGDRPAYDGLLQQFPVMFHEPYYADYIGQDLISLFDKVGLVHRGTELAFMSKVMTFERAA